MRPVLVEANGIGQRARESSFVERKRGEGCKTWELEEEAQQGGGGCWLRAVAIHVGGEGGESPTGFCTVKPPGAVRLEEDKVLV